MEKDSRKGKASESSVKDVESEAKEKREDADEYKRIVAKAKAAVRLKRKKTNEAKSLKAVHSKVKKLAKKKEKADKATEKIAEKTKKLQAKLHKLALEKSKVDAKAALASKAFSEAKEKEIETREAQSKAKQAEEFAKAKVKQLKTKGSSKGSDKNQTIHAKDILKREELSRKVDENRPTVDVKKDDNNFEKNFNDFNGNARLLLSINHAQNLGKIASMEKYYFRVHCGSERMICKPSSDASEVKGVYVMKYTEEFKKPVEMIISVWVKRLAGMDPCIGRNTVIIPPDLSHCDVFEAWCPLDHSHVCVMNTNSGIGTLPNKAEKGICVQCSLVDLEWLRLEREEKEKFRREKEEAEKIANDLRSKMELLETAVVNLKKNLSQSVYDCVEARKELKKTKFRLNSQKNQQSMSILLDKLDEVSTSSRKQDVAPFHISVPPDFTGLNPSYKYSSTRISPTQKFLMKRLEHYSK
eukprot:g721.t1